MYVCVCVCVCACVCASGAQLGGEGGGLPCRFLKIEKVS